MVVACDVKCLSCEAKARTAMQHRWLLSCIIFEYLLLTFRFFPCVCNLAIKCIVPTRRGIFSKFKNNQHLKAPQVASLEMSQTAIPTCFILEPMGKRFIFSLRCLHSFFSTGMTCRTSHGIGSNHFFSPPFRASSAVYPNTKKAQKGKDGIMSVHDHGIESMFVFFLSLFQPCFALAAACAASLLVASSSSAVSTAAPGRCTYRTTLPRMKTFLTELCDG